MWHKSVKLLLVVIFIFIPLIGCIAKNEPITTTDNIVIGFSQIGSESSWREASTKSILDTAQENGIQVILNIASQKQENQIKAIRSFIAYQVDVILLSPIVETGWDNVLNEAKLANIPVILVDRKILTDDDSLYMSYVGSDFFKEGRMAASYLKRKFKNRTDQINIVELQGVFGSTPARGRSSGFVDSLADDDRFNIVFSDSGDFMRSKGKEITRHVIKSKTDFEVLFSHNDSMTLGALEALDEAGIIPGQDVVVISFDAEQASIDELLDGRINCVIECSPYLGDKVIEVVKLLVNNQEAPRETYSIERSFTEFDLDLHELDSRGY